MSRERELNRIKQLGLRAIDNVLTFGGTLAPRAQDVAVIGSDEDLERKTVVFRCSSMLASLEQMALNGIKTSGSFEIGSSFGNMEYAGSRILGSGINPVKRRLGLWFYDEVYDVTYKRYFEIPRHVREKIEDNLKQKGIPENRISEWTITSTIHDIRKESPVEQIVKCIGSPAVQFLAAGEHLDWRLKTATVALAYLGIAAGLFLGKKSDKLRFEWDTARTTVKQRRDFVLKEIASKSAELWSKDNLKRYNNFIFSEDLIRTAFEVFGVLTIVFSKSAQVFGLSSFLAESAIGFSTGMDLGTKVQEGKIDAKITRTAAEFMVNGPILPNEEAWKRFALTQRDRYSIKECQKPGLVVLEDFCSSVLDKESKPVTVVFEPGKVYFLNASSGDGKSIFLEAISGRTRHNGFAWVRQDGTMVPIIDRCQKQLEKIVAYFTPSKNGEGMRIVDLFTNQLIIKMKQEGVGENLIRAMLLEDSLLERMIEGRLNAWEHDIFGVRALKDEIQVFRDQRIELAREALVKLGKNINDILPLEPTGSLSKGMLVRVQLGSYLDSQSNILLLDEPVSSLDVQSAKDTMAQAIGRIKNNSTQGMIIVTHAHKMEMIDLAKQILGEENIESIDLEK